MRPIAVAIPMRCNFPWTSRGAAGSAALMRGRGRARARLLSLVLLSCLVCACGAGVRSRPAATGHDAPASEYDTTGTQPAVLGRAHAAELEQALADAARDAGLDLRGDGRLARIAASLPPAKGATLGAQAPARALGIVDVAFDLERVQPRAGQSLADALRAQLAAPLRAFAPTHFGIYVEDRARAARVLFSRRPLTLAPIARVLPAGATVVVRGRLAATYRDPKLVVSGPGGVITLPAGSGPDFDVRVPLRATGNYRLVLQARTAQGSAPVAELIVGAGANPRARGPARAPGSPAQIARFLYERTAALRAAHGLAPLQVDAGLSRRAEQSSAALASGAAPPSMEGGLALRAVARASDGRALWSMLTADPGLRSALLSGEVTHIGIGVSRARDGYVSTHLLAQLATAVDDDLAPARVLGAINRNRAARAAGALRPDPELTRVARETVRELLAHPERSDRDVLDAANGDLERFRLAYGRVAALAVMVVDPLAAAALEPALDPSARAVGIAVARGERAGSTPGSAAVVLVLGWERRDEP